MMPRKWILCAVCLLGATSYATHAWTQSGPLLDRERERAGDLDRPSADARPGNYNRTTGPSVKGQASGQGMKPAGAMMPGGGQDSMQMMRMMMGASGHVPMRSRTVSRTIHEVVHEPMPPEEAEQLQAFHDAIQALKDAKDEADKKKASETIREQLLKQFERDLVSREEELAEVEQRVKSLRQQLDKRKASKDDIVTLRLKTVINNAEGLGFPGEEASVEAGTRAVNDFGGPMPRGLSGAAPVGRPFGGPVARD